jgi:serine protease
MKSSPSLCRVLACLGLFLAVSEPGIGQPLSPGGPLLVVKFVEGSGIRVRGGSLRSQTGSSLRSFEQILSAWPGTTVERVFSRPEGELERDRAELVAQGQTDLPDLNLFYHLRLPPATDTAAVLRELTSLGIVETAYVAYPGAPATINIESQQIYLDGAPDGTGGRSVWSLAGATGVGVTIADVEACWNTSHEDLSKVKGDRILLYDGLRVDCPSGYENHGTAVAGELVADHNSFGVTGMAYGANIVLAPVRTCTSYLGLCIDDPIENPADAINRAYSALQSGDVILVEWQIPKAGASSGTDFCSQQSGMVAVENRIAEYAAIKFATGRGIVVVEAAGNGQQNLDAVEFEGRFDRSQRDSGAILVGAGAAPGGSSPARSRLCFSNHGSRLDVQAWGEKVVTTGYGDHPASGLLSGSAYTAVFAGTSSASPMVAAAAADVQGHRKAQGNPVLSPLALRDLLAGTGTPQVGTENIGPQVDVAAAIRSLDAAPAITGATADSTLGCKGSSTRQWVNLTGTGFVRGSKVILNDGSSDYEIPEDRTEFTYNATASTVRVCAGVLFSSHWTAKVVNLRSQTYQTSTPFAFTVGGSAPAVTLTASPSTISSGGSATLSWSTANVTSCSAAGGWSGSKATNGSQSVSPSGTTTYTLTCTGSSGSASGSATVTVAGGSGPPQVFLDAFPDTVAPGGSVGLGWATTGATSCTASGGWSGSTPTTGSASVFPSSTTTYTLTCTGPGGSAVDSVTVTVSTAPSVSLSASPEGISPGGSSTLSWTSNGMASCSASGGWSGSRSLSGSQTVTPSSTTTYTLTCTEASNGTSELVRNGAFTGTASEWVKTGSFFTDARFSTCHSCPGYSYLSAADGSISTSNNLVGWIEQDVAIPASATSVTLSFWTSITTLETTTTQANDNVLVWLKDTSGNAIRNLVSLSNLDAGGYRQISASLNPERGRTVRLEFLGSTNATNGTVFRFDDVSIQASMPPVQHSDSATVTVTAQQVPGVALTASPDTISPGESSTLAWISSATTSCTASGGWSGTKPLSGNQVVVPATTTTYTLTCNGPGGTAAASATIVLRQPPPSVSLTASPASIPAGSSSTLSWNSANATSCVATGAWEGLHPTSGSDTVSPPATANYTLVCQGAGGTGMAQATVTVIPHTITFTAEPAGTPNPVASGGSVSLSVQAADSQGHFPAWSWFSSCPEANGTFSNPSSRTPIWTAPVNTTDAPLPCLIGVTASDGQISATSSFVETVQPVPPQTAADYWTLTPCRLFDTRDPTGPFGGPILASGVVRSFALAGRCGIPASAMAISVNLTSVTPTALGYLKVYPGDAGTVSTSALNFGAGQVRGNNAIVPVAADGSGTVNVLPFLSDGGTVHAVLDVNGYFAPSTNSEVVRVLTQGSPGAPGKDIWTTSVFSYDGVTSGPGGGRDDDRLVVGGWGDEYDALLEFDLTGLPQQVAEARLELFCLTSRSGVTTSLYLDRIAAAWDWRTQGTGRDRERLWWSDKPVTTPWRPAALPEPVQGAWYTLDITDLYQEWKNGTQPNYGLQLRPSSGANRWSEFASSEHADSALRPRLVIVP